MMQRFAMVLCAALALAACDRGPTPEQRRAAAAQARAAKDLDAYRQLVAAGSYELAYSQGQNLLATYPNSPIAAEVAKTFPDVEAKAKGAIDARRLANLWMYQQGTEQGGTQHVASIYSSVPGGPDQVRLLLRQHSAWGRSAYLFAGGAGFDCPAPCRLRIRFDDAPASDWAGEIPSTGEPAVFIVDDERFVAKLAAAKTITIDAVRKDRGPVALTFEVGGFDGAKWP
jgi:hypothetical protein